MVQAVQARRRSVELIRPADLGDAKILQRFWHAIVQEGLVTLPLLNRSPSVEQCRREITACIGRPNSVWLLAFQGTKLVGNLRFVGYSEPARAHAGVLGMAVAAPFRGKGVGGELLTALARWAPGARVTRLELEVFDGNLHALALYEAHGFVREGARRRALVVRGQAGDLIEMARFVEP